MAFPKIIYNPGTGNVTLTFLRPPRRVPNVFKRAERTDTISTAGVKQTILQRIEEFLEFEMEWVSTGADADAWKSFMDYALTGGQFDYYPDASLGTFTTYTLEDQEHVQAYKSVGMWTFKLKFRKVVP